MAAFKNEKEFEKWLQANPSAAKRIQVQKAAEAAAPVLREATERMLDPEWPNVKPKLATPNGTSVVVKLPTRTAPANHYAAFVSKFDHAMVWIYVGVVAAGSVGVVATVSAMLALEYLR